jgi:hypothetical protein
MLHVNLFGLIPGKCGGKPVEATVFLSRSELISIEEVAFGVLVTEKEPIFPRMAVLLTVLKKRTEGGDPSAGANHNDVTIRGGQVKVTGGLNIDGDGGLVRQMGEVTRCEALFAASMGGVLDDSHGQVNFAGTVIGRGCD